MLFSIFLIHIRLMKRLKSKRMRERNSELRMRMEIGTKQEIVAELYILIRTV